MSVDDYLLCWHARLQSDCTAENMAVADDYADTPAYWGIAAENIWAANNYADTPAYRGTAAKNMLVANDSAIKGTVKLYFFFAEKDAPSVYKKRDVFIFLKFHLCSNNFQSFFRGPVTINMGLGLWKCRDGPVKSVSGQYSMTGKNRWNFLWPSPCKQWRAHEKMTEKYTKVAILSML